VICSSRRSDTCLGKQGVRKEPPWESPIDSNRKGDALVAVAVNEDGKREVLGVATGPSEAETFWTDFLRGLADRGLRGVKLVIADDHKGLRAAARRVFDATHQRCRVHWLRNALAHAPTKQRTAVAAMLRTIFAQETKAEAEAQWAVVADALREKQPRLGAMMDASRDDGLAYMTFPASTGRGSRRQIRLSGSTARSSAAPMSSASFRTMMPSSASSARSCSRPTTNGPSRAGT
jgi:transposase-like protein